MLSITDEFQLDYFGSDLIYGRGRTERLSEVLANRDFDRALVVCGSNVGRNESVMQPIQRGLGDRLVGVFDETTPAKRAETVYDGIEKMEELGSDVLIGIGGGSSLDITRQMSVFAAHDSTLSSLRKDARSGQVPFPNPDGPLTSVVAVPTTFAGADMSSGGSIEVLSASDSPTGQPIRASGSVMPEAILHDPALFETTPLSALAGSAMNGFNKGVETLYSSTATPITDGTSIHGLRLLYDSLPRLSSGGSDAMERAVLGTILVQFKRRTSIIHAFGHGFARRYPIQQGAAHAIVAPPVLRYVFSKVDARREHIAEGLDIDIRGRTDEEIADAIVEVVTEIRDSLDVPTRLRALDGVVKEDFPAVARFIVDDLPDERLPSGLDPTVDDIEAVLQDVW